MSKKFNSRRHRPGGSSRSFRFGQREPRKKLTQPEWDLDTLVPINNAFYIPHQDVVDRCEDYLNEFITINKIETKGENIPKPIIHFEEGNFPEYVLQHIREKDYKLPTAIQAQGIPVALSGRDLIGISKENSGKTIAYILSMIVHIHNQKPLATGEGPIVLILAATNAVAQETHAIVREFIRGGPLSALLVCGGETRSIQIEKLAEGAEIVVASPGRLTEFLGIEAINFKRCSMVILDNAVDLIDLKSQINPIMNQIRPDRQLLIFSAKWPTKLQLMIEPYLKDFIQINLLPPSTGIKHTIQIVNTKLNRMQRFIEFVRIHDANNNKKMLIFVASKNLTRKVRINLIKLRKTAHALLAKTFYTEKHITRFNRGFIKYLLVKDKFELFQMLGTGYVDYVVNFGYPYSSEIFKKRMECAKRFCPDASINTIFEKTLKAGEFIQYLNDTDQKIPPALMNLYKTFSQGVEAREPVGRKAIMNKNMVSCLKKFFSTSDKGFIPMELSSPEIEGEVPSSPEIEGEVPSSPEIEREVPSSSEIEREMPSFHGGLNEETKRKHFENMQHLEENKREIEEYYLESRERQSRERERYFQRPEDFSSYEGNRSRMAACSPITDQRVIMNRSLSPTDNHIMYRKQIQMEDNERASRHQQNFNRHPGGEERYSPTEAFFEQEFLNQDQSLQRHGNYGDELFGFNRPTKQQPMQQFNPGRFERKPETAFSFQPQQLSPPMRLDQMDPAYNSHREYVPYEGMSTNLEANRQDEFCNRSSINVDNYQRNQGGVSPPPTGRSLFDERRARFAFENERPPQRAIEGRQDEFELRRAGREGPSSTSSVGRNWQNEFEMVRNERERPLQQPTIEGRQDEFAFFRQSGYSNQREGPFQSTIEPRQDEFELRRSGREEPSYSVVGGGQQNEFELRRGGREEPPYSVVSGGQQNEFEFRQGGREEPLYSAFGGSRKNEFEFETPLSSERERRPSHQSTIGGRQDEFEFRRGGREELSYSEVGGGRQNEFEQRSRGRVERDRSPLRSPRYFPTREEPRSPLPPSATPVTRTRSPKFMIDRIGNVDRAHFNEMDYPRRRDVTPERRNNIHFGREEHNLDYIDRRREVDLREQSGNSQWGSRRHEERRDAQDNRRDFNERKKFPNTGSKRGERRGGGGRRRR